MAQLIRGNEVLVACAALFLIVIVAAAVVLSALRSERKNRDDVGS
jgi:hypothetical protein